MPRAEPALSLAPLHLPAVVGAAIRTAITTTTLRRRGREGSRPPSPRTDPSVRYYRTRLFRQTRFRNSADAEECYCLQ